MSSIVVAGITIAVILSGRGPAATSATAPPETIQTVQARLLTRYRDARRRWNNLRSTNQLTPERKARIKQMLEEIEPTMRELASSQLGESINHQTTNPPNHQLSHLSQLEQTVRNIGFMLYPSRPNETRALWYFRGAHSDWDDVMTRLKQAGFNTLYLRAARGGNAMYPSAHVPMDAWAKALNHDELKEAIDAAHRHGIRLIAWKVNYHAGTAPRDFFEQLRAEDRLVRDPEGRQGVFLNPADPRNRELDFNIAKELVEKYDIDGYQFDYIRYPDERPIPSPARGSGQGEASVPVRAGTEGSPYHWDYGAVSRREFEKSLGRPVDNWPEDVISGELKIRYEDWEREQIDRHVERIYRMIKATKPRVEVGAAVWRNPKLQRAWIKQDWRRWVRNGWLDVAVPMDYTDNMRTLKQDLDLQTQIMSEGEGEAPAEPGSRGRSPSRSLSRNDRRAPALVIGLGTYLTKTPEDVLEQIELTRKYGAHGFAYFSWFTTHRDEDFEAMRLGATAEDCTYPLSPSLKRKGNSTGGRLALAKRKHFSSRTLLGAGNRNSSPSLSGKGTGVRSGPRIAVFREGMGSKNILMELRRAGCNALPIERLTRAELQRCDLLVLPQVTDYAVWTDEAVRILRVWVEGGGNILLTRDAVGAFWHPRLFRQVGIGAGRHSDREIEFVVDVGATLRGRPHNNDRPVKSLTHASSDHTFIEPAHGSTVLARDKEGLAIVVEGKASKGKVIQCGFAIGNPDTQPMTNEEKQVLLWLVSHLSPVPSKPSRRFASPADFPEREGER